MRTGAIFFAMFLGFFTFSAFAQPYDPSQQFPEVDPVQPSAGSEPGVLRGASGNLILNGGIENNGGVGTTIIDDWTVFSVPGSSSGMPGVGNFVVYSGTTTPLSAQTIEAPTEGTFAAVSDTSGATSNILFQDVSIPSGGGSLSCDVFFNNQSGANINAGNLDFESQPNQHARVDIMDPGAPIDDTGAGVLANLFITEAGDPTFFSYFALQADLTPFAGQTVRLRFAEVNNQFFQNLAVDNCSIIGFEASQSVPALSWAGLAIAAVMLLCMGLLLLRRRV